VTCIFHVDHTPVTTRSSASAYTAKAPPSSRSVCRIGLPAKALYFYWRWAWPLIEFAVPSCAAAGTDCSDDRLLEFTSFAFGFVDLGVTKVGAGVELGKVRTRSRVAGVECDDKPDVGIEAVDSNAAAILQSFSIEVLCGWDRQRL
jgi:hypothetical protein